MCTEYRVRCFSTMKPYTMRLYSTTKKCTCTQCIIRVYLQLSTSSAVIITHPCWRSIIVFQNRLESIWVTARIKKPLRSYSLFPLYHLILIENKLRKPHLLFLGPNCISFALWISAGWIIARSSQERSADEAAPRAIIVYHLMLQSRLFMWVENVGLLFTCGIESKIMPRMLFLSVPEESNPHFARGSVWGETSEMGFGVRGCSGMSC